MKRVLNAALFALILLLSPPAARVQSDPQTATKAQHPTAQNLKKQKKEEDNLCSWYKANYRYLSRSLNAVKVPSPEYPEEAKKAGIAGTVIVAVRVDPKGHVEFAAACEGHPLLKESAVQAAYKAEFQPVMVKGKATKFLTALTYGFNKPLLKK
jgi:TonB family protein